MKYRFVKDRIENGCSLYKLIHSMQNTRKSEIHSLKGRTL